MTLAALIRKRERDSGESATAIPAISATQADSGRATVARIATIAVATSQVAEAVAPDPASEARCQRAANEAAASMHGQATTPEEREVVNWLKSIGEGDATVFRETLGKCRANADALSFFLGLARGINFCEPH